MKKISGFLSVLLCFLFLFCGCGKTNDNSGNNSNDNSAAETAIDIDTSNYSEYLSITSEKISTKPITKTYQYKITYSNGTTETIWSDTLPNNLNYAKVEKLTLFQYKHEYLFSIKINLLSNARCKNVKLLIGDYSHGYKEITINGYDEITELLTMIIYDGYSYNKDYPPKVLFVSGKVYLPSAE